MEEIFCIHYSMKIFRIILLLLFCLSIHRCSPSSKVPPKAVNGVLDLRDWDFEKDGIVNLDGEWEFYWEKYCKPIEYIPTQEESGLQNCEKGDLSGLIKVPNPWNEFKVDGKEIGSMGYGTYKLKVLLKEQGDYALRTEYISYYKVLLLKNKKFLTNKNIITSKEKFLANPKRDIINFNDSTIEIFLIASNYEIMLAGIRNSITLGNKDEIFKTFYQKLSLDLILIGCLLILGLYHIGLWSHRTTDLSLLNYSLICIALSIRSLVVGSDLIYYIAPFFPWRFGIKLGYILYSLSIFLFLNYLYYLKKPKYIILNKLLKIYYLTLSILFIFLGDEITKKISDFTLIFIIFTIIYIVIELYFFDRYIKKIILVIFFLFSLSIINDILNTLLIIKTTNLSQYGFLLFFIAQAYLLSSISSKIYYDNERLTVSLENKIQELELTKERATQAYLELEASQKQLVQSDKMITLGTMLAGVAHEINTPLGAIKANSENILEVLRGLILKLNPSLSHLTLDELQISLRILELSKESTTPFSSREARALRKKVISLLEERNLSNVDLLTDFIVELNLVEALERKEEIFFSPGLEKVLSLAYDLHGIRKKSTVIQTSAERVSKIVKSLKSFMHFDQNEKKVLADLTEGMETVLIILHNKIKMGIEVTKNYGEDVPQILCFPDELNQVWTNLIHNAIQAMDEKGSLQIDIEKVPNPKGNPDIDKRNPNYTGEYISVSIQDSGSGIPPEIREKIFQAFFTTKPAGEGSGLGLHIIGKILEKHEGALYLESEPGRTRFSVLLPLGNESEV
jgi:two-component system, NtrC family, sensor kinase